MTFARAFVVAGGLALGVILCLVLASSPAVGAISPVTASAPPSRFAASEPTPGSAPSASPEIIQTVDPRSNGQGPGLVGSPFAILVGVFLLGLAAAGGTLLYLRLTRRE